MTTVNANYFYVYYSPTWDQYGWGIRENEDDEFYNHVVNGTHVECEFVYGALVETRHIEVLKNLLEKYEDTVEWITAIDIFSKFV